MIEFKGSTESLYPIIYGRKEETMNVWVVCNVTNNEPCPVVFATHQLAKESLMRQFSTNDLVCDEDHMNFKFGNGQEFHIYCCEIHGDFLN